MVTAVEATTPHEIDRSLEASTPTASSRIVARRLTKSFDDTEVIHPIDLDVDAGTIIGLIGPSGCGKTTTVRLLAGLLEPTNGTVFVDGTPATELTAAQRARIGYLPQTPALFSDLSLNENLSFHASMYGLPFRRRQRLDDMLEWVELAEHRSKRVADSSGGMQRRLALAAAFVHDPDLVFLDEPTAGIDPILREKFWREFRAVARTGKTLVVTTQYVDEAGQCDLVGLLSDGDLLMLDTPKNLRRAAFDGEVVDVQLSRPIAEADVARLAAQPFVVGEIEYTAADSLRIVVGDLEPAIEGLEDFLHGMGLETVEISEHVVDYDEAFVRVVKRHRQTEETGNGDGAADGDGNGTTASEGITR